MSGTEKRRAVYCASVRLTPGERRAIGAAAARADLGMSAFLRCAGLAAAQGRAVEAARPGLPLARWTAAVGPLADAVADLAARCGPDGPAAAEVAALRTLVRDLDAAVVRAADAEAGT